MFFLSNVEVESITHEKAFFLKLYQNLQKNKKLYLKERNGWYGSRSGVVSFIESPTDVPSIRIAYGAIEIDMLMQHNTGYPYRYKISGVCDQMAIKCIGNKIDQVPK